MCRSHDLSHKTEAWYWEGVSRFECNAAVCASEPGDYLVRDAANGSKMVIVINDHGQPANYQARCRHRLDAVRPQASMHCARCTQGIGARLVVCACMAVARDQVGCRNMPLLTELTDCIAWLQVRPAPNGKYLVSTAEYTKVADVLASMCRNHPNGNSGKPLPLRDAVTNPQKAEYRIKLVANTHAPTKGCWV